MQIVSCGHVKACFLGKKRKIFQNVIYLQNRSALAVICWVINHCLEVSCKVDQITSTERKWFIYLQLADKLWFITQQIMQKSQSISILTHRNSRVERKTSVTQMVVFPQT